MAAVFVLSGFERTTMHLEIACEEKLELEERHFQFFIFMQLMVYNVKRELNPKTIFLQSMFYRLSFSSEH